jgi:hypothetical protein
MGVLLDRPFYFVVVLWGERFRNYLLEYCLPSLLAPGNFPSLSTRRRSKLLIATTSADWAAMQASAVLREVGRYLDLELVEIPPCPQDASAFDHMGVGHRRACDLAFRDGAYTAVLTPDCMLSDGSVARLQQLALDGCQLVVAAALRFSEEKFLGNLRDAGALPAGPRGEEATPLAITGRQMARAAVNGLHRETLAYAWDAPGFILVAPAAWWPVPGADGIVLHSLSWAPVLLDYAAIPRHDSSTLDRWTLDGDYLYNNSQQMAHIHVVQDSDELFLASWGPETDRPVEKQGAAWFGKLAAKAQFGASYKSAFFDPFKRRIFFLPVRWHAQPLDAKWRQVEARAMSELRRYVTPPDQRLRDGANGIGDVVLRVAARGLTVLLVMLRPVFLLAYHREAVWRRLRQAAAGDRAALRRVLWYVRLFGFNK